MQHGIVKYSQATSLYWSILARTHTRASWHPVTAESYFKIAWTQPLKFYGRKQFHIGRKLNWMPYRSFPHMRFHCTKRIHFHSNVFSFVIFKLWKQKKINIFSHKWHSFNSVNWHKPQTLNSLNIVENIVFMDHIYS